MRSLLAIAALALSGAAALALHGQAAHADCVAGICPPPTTVPLPTTTTTAPPPKPAPDTAAMARRLFDLVNQERTSRGLPALARRADIETIAAPHTAAMAAKYDIWHNDAYFTTATHAFLGATFLGENVAMNPTIENMHVRLMNSPHHRDNILDPRFRQVGVSVVAAPDGELFATEDFAQPRPPAATPSPPAAVKPAAAAKPPLPVTVPTAPPDTTTTTAESAPDLNAALPAAIVPTLPASAGHTKHPAGLALLALAGIATASSQLRRYRRRCPAS